MHPLIGDERRRVLRALLPDEDRPGDQVGFQLASHDVGDAFVDDDAASAVVVVDRLAVVFGTAAPWVGRLLDEQVFVGVLQGATASLDPVPAVAGLTAEVDLGQCRVFYESDAVRSSTRLDLAPLVARRVQPDDDAAIGACEGRWVTELWPRPSDAAFSRALFDSEGGVLGIAAGYARSPRYVEIAAWVDPIVAGNRLVAAEAESFLGEVLDAGMRISSAVLQRNHAAHRFAAGAGWTAVAEQRVVGFPPPPAGSGRAWERLRRR